MGRRKGQIAAMASLQLVKDRHKGQGRRPGSDDSFLHTTELNDGTTYNRINFQSVTEQNNLEDFLTTAEMAGRDFTAERQAIQIISNPGQHTRLTEDDLAKINLAQENHRAALQIPRRPHWDQTTTKEELLLAEREAFTNWRRQLKMLEEEEHIQLTPYEKNLDFWRQLWRVIERSDVIVQIVDARNPLLFRCEDLESYVKQVDPHKTCMLLVNKADYLTLQQRQQWVEYFNSQGITAVFFSAKTEKEKQEGPLNPEPAISEVKEEDTSGEEDDEDDDDDEDDEEDDEDEDEDDVDPTGDAKKEAHKKLDSEKEKDAKDEKEIDESVVNRVSSEVDSMQISETDYMGDKTTQEAATVRGAIPTSTTDEVQCACSHPQDSDKSSQILSSAPGNQTDIASSSALCSPEDSNDTTPTSVSTGLIQNSPNIVSSEELLEIFRGLAHPAASQRSGSAGEVKTVGMVGYPNVGKSSTINVILEEKKLAVSATPGRTKHLQTLYVDPHLVLCDCPGLVFPSFVATKAHLVINGILPIDEMRSHSPPVGLVCEHIPRHVLEATYSIMIPRPSLDDLDPDRIPTSEELLNAYGAMRGFMTQRGVPDGPRAARYILKDYVKGKLLYCEPPPGVNGPDFQDKNRVAELCQHKPVAKIPPPQIRSDVDKEFFSKKRTKAHSRGVKGVSDFVRTDTLQQTSRGSDPAPEGMASGHSLSVSSLNSQMSTVGGKPWKKHNNRNKKEKLRRLHRDLDI